MSQSMFMLCIKFNRIEAISRRKDKCYTQPSVWLSKAAQYGRTDRTEKLNNGIEKKILLLCFISQGFDKLQHEDIGYRLNSLTYGIKLLKSYLFDRRFNIGASNIETYNKQ